MDGLYQPNPGARPQAEQVLSESAIPGQTVHFDTFFADHYDNQVRRAYLLVGSVAAAHDVVAEAFTAIYRRWDLIDDPVLYLNRCVTNGSHDLHRRGGRWIHSPLDPADDNVGHNAAANGSAAEQSTGQHARVELAQALSTLPYRQRAAIVLRYYGRENEADIAQILGCRPGTVGSLIHRGLRRLRKELS